EWLLVHVDGRKQLRNRGRNRAHVYNHGIDHDIGRQRLQSEMGDFNSIASALQLHRLDARGSHIQANNRLRSESKHVPAFTVARQLSRLPSVSSCFVLPSGPTYLPSSDPASTSLSSSGCP